MHPPWSTATSTITAPGLHRPHHVLGHHDRGAAGRHEDRADHEVGVGHGTRDRAAVRRQRHDAALVDLVDPPEPVDVLVEQEHLGLHALRDPRAVPPDVARAEHHDPRRPDAGDPAEQHAPAAELALEEPGADLGGHPARDLAHRGEQGERAVDLDGLVGDAGRAVLEQRRARPAGTRPGGGR